MKISIFKAGFLALALPIVAGCVTEGEIPMENRFFKDRSNLYFPQKDPEWVKAHPQGEIPMENRFFADRSNLYFPQKDPEWVRAQKDPVAEAIRDTSEANYMLGVMRTIIETVPLDWKKEEF